MTWLSELGDRVGGGVVTETEVLGREADLELEVINAGCPRSRS